MTPDPTKQEKTISDAERRAIFAKAAERGFVAALDGRAQLRLSASEIALAAAIGGHHA